LLRFSTFSRRTLLFAALFACAIPSIDLPTQGIAVLTAEGRL